MLFALPDRQSSSAIATGSRHNTKKCCRRLHAVVPLRWVDIAISARHADALPSRITRAEIGIAHAVRETRVCVGCRPANENCCLRPTCTLCSPCHANSRHWRCRTSGLFTTCCFTPALKPCWRSPAIPVILVPTSASSACCTPGISACNTIPTSTAWLPLAASP